MGNYFDNLGRSIGPIKLGTGVWLSSEADSNKMTISKDKAATELSEVYVKSPTMTTGIKVGDATLPKNQVATVEWVAWAYGVKPEFNLDEYNTIKTNVDQINTKIPTIESSLNTLKDSVSAIELTIASENISKLNDLFSQSTILILKGGRAASRAEVN